MLQLRTFGGCLVERDGGDVAVLAGHRKALALLARLAAAGPRGVPREALLALLWPESDDARARDSLKQLVRLVRTRLGDEGIVTGGDVLRLDPSRLAADVTAFRDALARGAAAEAAVLHTGPFLDGFWLRGHDDFERWVSDERAALAREAVQACEALAQGAAASGDVAAAAAWWRRLLVLDPLHGAAVVGLMGALEQAGDRAGALRVAQLHAERLRAELDLEPDAAVRTLVERLRRAPAVQAPVPHAHTPIAHTQIAHMPIAHGADEPHAAAPVAIDTTVPHATPPAAPTAAARDLRGTSPRRTRRPLRVGVAALALAGGVAAAAWMLRPARDADPTRLLVADFAVHGTADPSLGRVLAELARTDLRASRAARLVPADTVRAALERMRRAPAAPLDGEVARELAVREGIPAVVLGDVTPAGDGIVVTLRVVTAGGDPIATAYASTTMRDVLPATERVVRDLRARLGESLESVRASEPLLRVTTASLPALRHYVDGAHALHAAHDTERARTLLREAVALDTAFASAWSLLAEALRAARGMPAATIADAEARAYRHRDRLPAAERYAVTAAFLRTRDRAAAAAALEAGLRLDTARFAGDLARLHASRREYARAEALYRWLLAAGDDAVLTYTGLANVVFAQGRRAEAESLMAQGARRNPAVVPPHRWAYSPWSRARFDSAQRILETELAAMPVAQRFGTLMLLGDVHLARGRLADATAVREAAAAAGAARGIPRDSAGEAVSAASFALHQRGDTAGALARLDAALARWPLASQPPVTAWSSSLYPWGELRHLVVARLYAQAGRPARARALLAAMTTELRDTALVRVSAPARELVQGEIALAEGRPLAAVAAFRAAERMPDGFAHGCAICTDVHVARAFDAAGARDSAIAYYTRFLERPHLWRITHDAWHRARVLQRLAVLHAARGDVARATRAVDALAWLWRDADAPGRSLVAEARARLATVPPREARIASAATGPAGRR